jgi:hypothetical protein
MNKIVGDYSDEKFTTSFVRYDAIDKVLESSSFKELEEKIYKSYSPKAAEYLMGAFFNEFKLQNSVIALEYDLCRYLENSRNNDLLEDPKKAKDYLIAIMQRKHKKQDVEMILNEALRDDDGNLYTPHILFLIIGMSLGKFIAFIKCHIKNSEEKTILLERLDEFNERRNLLVHNLLSSRVVSIDNTRLAIDLSDEIRKSLKDRNGDF